MEGREEGGEAKEKESDVRMRGKGDEGGWRTSC